MDELASLEESAREIALERFRIIQPTMSATRGGVFLTDAAARHNSQWAEIYFFQEKSRQFKHDCRVHSPDSPLAIEFKTTANRRRYGECSQRGTGKMSRSRYG